jgi:pilus assembly protein CpaB
MIRRIAFSALAVGLAGAGTAGVGWYAHRSDTRALEGQQAVETYVAVDTVPRGTSAEDAIAKGLIERQELADKAVPDGALTSVDEETQDLVAQGDIPAGSLVMQTVFGPKVANEAETGGLDIPEGKIAVAVEIRNADGDAVQIPGLVVGSQVAVFDTFNVRDRPGRNNAPSGDGISPQFDNVQGTRLVVPRAEVIAVGQPGSEDDNADSEAVSVVTLAVTQAEAERLAQISFTGLPSVALLGPDSSIKPGEGIDSTTLFDYGA